MIKVFHPRGGGDPRSQKNRFPHAREWRVLITNLSYKIRHLLLMTIFVFRSRWTASGEFQNLGWFTVGWWVSFIGGYGHDGF